MQSENNTVYPDQEQPNATQSVPGESKMLQPRLNIVHVKNRKLEYVDQKTEQKAKRMKKNMVLVSDSEVASGSNDDSFVEMKSIDAELSEATSSSDDDLIIEKKNINAIDKKNLLEFFQTATSNEFQLMDWISKKKAEVIIENRPFRNWSDLVTKLRTQKPLHIKILATAHDLLIKRHNIEILLKDCKMLAVQLEQAVAAAGFGIKLQPSLLDSSYRLTNYQMVGLNWLAVLHTQRLNGILADEMGLGKTIQVIAFLAHLKEISTNSNFPHLVVVPASTLDNWQSEFEKWCPALNVFKYYGSTEERKMFRKQNLKNGKHCNYDVILTTYSLVSNTPAERHMFKEAQMHYIIFDEAHVLKNMNTQRYEQLIKIKAQNRILLTGTPLQNNLLELMSLLIFVMPSMFAQKRDNLKSLFQKMSKSQKNEDDFSTFEKQQISQAKDIMQPFILRRLKCNVLPLPKKTCELIEIQLPPTQTQQYQNLVNYFKNKGREHVLTIVSKLRRASNHPLLLRSNYHEKILVEIAKLLASEATDKHKNAWCIQEDLSVMSDFEIHSLCKAFEFLKKYQLPDPLILTSGKFWYLDDKLQEFKRTGHRVLIFSQFLIMLDIIEEYLQIRNHRYLRLDGTTAVPLRKALIDQFNSDPDIFIFLLSTRAGGLGINLTAADTVIIHDIDFNPYNDKQAEDRCHRMGQTNPVQVFRLISQGTIEEGMWQINEDKLKLERKVTGEESETLDRKSVVRLLSSILGAEATNLSNFDEIQSTSQNTESL